MNMSQKQLDSLVKAASSRLGVSEAKLRSELEAGTFDSLMRKMAPGDAGRLQAALSDHEKTKAMLSSPQAREILKKLIK